MKFVRNNAIELVIIIICLLAAGAGLYRGYLGAAVLMVISALLTAAQIIRKGG